MHDDFGVSGGAEPRPSRRRHLAVVATFDSFLKAALPIADHLRHRGYEASFVLAQARPNQISERQLAAMGFQAPIETKPLAAIVTDPDLYQADVVLLAMDGARTSEFLYRFRAGLPVDACRRPMTLAGYPGVVFQCAIHGLANRAGCDLLLLNSPADLEQYLAISEAFGADASNALCFGLTILADTPRALPPAAPPRTLLFLEQPDIPKHKVERLYLVERLVAYARRHPERRLLVKPRHQPHETTLKRTTFHLEPVIERVRRAGHLPANLELTYEPVEQLLEQADLCLTVSSTAALQAAALGVPFGIITDFGVREDYGTHFFIGSGCLVSFDQLDGDQLPALAATWRDRHVLPAARNLDRLVERIDGLLTAQTAAGAPLPLREIGFQSETAALLAHKFVGDRRSRALTALSGFVAASTHATTKTALDSLLRKGRKLLGNPGLFLSDLWRKRFVG